MGRGGCPPTPQLPQAQEGVVVEQRTWQPPAQSWLHGAVAQVWGPADATARETTHHLCGTHSPWSYNDC